jgi:hypothetical protein
LYYEEKDEFNATEKKLTPLKGSKVKLLLFFNCIALELYRFKITFSLHIKIEFFKNGVSHGIAFTDIYKGVYYPAVSLYKNASVKFKLIF